MRFEKWFMPLLACILSGAVVCAEENSRPVFLFPSVQQASDSSLARRRAAARREGETAIALHDPQLAEQKFLQYCELTPDAAKVLEASFDKLGLSARAYDKILKVARTIADLDNADMIEKRHLLEALQYRSLDRKFWKTDD